MLTLTEQESKDLLMLAAYGMQSLAMRQVANGMMMEDVQFKEFATMLGQAFYNGNVAAMEGAVRGAKSLFDASAVVVHPVVEAFDRRNRLTAFDGLRARFDTIHNMIRGTK